jgi:hypothetical protein
MALLAALSALRDRHQSASVSLVVQLTDIEMAVNARRHGWTAVSLAFPGTLGIIDPPALLAALHPLLRERDQAAAGMTVSATAERATFSLDGDRYHVAAPGPLAARSASCSAPCSRCRCSGRATTTCGASRSRSNPPPPAP